MIERLIAWSVRRYLGGPARAWVFSSLAVLGYRFVKGRTGRRELVDIGKISTGDRIVIEAVPETHKAQIQAERRATRAAKAAARRARSERRRARRQARAERRAGSTSTG